MVSNALEAAAVSTSWAHAAGHSGRARGAGWAESCACASPGINSVDRVMVETGELCSNQGFGYRSKFQDFPWLPRISVPLGKSPYRAKNISYLKFLNLNTQFTVKYLGSY